MNKTQRRPRTVSWKRFLRFRLINLFAIISLTAVLLGLFCLRLTRANEQREAVSALKAMGADIFYDYQRDAQGYPSHKGELELPRWMRSLLGDDFFADVEIVQIGDSVNMEDALRMADEAVEQGQVADIAYGPMIPKFVDSDLPILLNFPGLRWLSLDCKGVTDNGVPHLCELRGLERLKLNNSGISNEGTSQLAAELPSCQIER